MTDYKTMLEELKYILDKSDDNISTLSNASAIINNYLADINWVGFYIYKDEALILGPFQGLHACTRIRLENGVCGYCARNKEAIIVDNVLEYPTHIACDSRSRSEICIPIINKDKLYGLLDIDSELFSRFKENDLNNLCKAVEIIASRLNF